MNRTFLQSHLLAKVVTFGFFALSPSIFHLLWLNVPVTDSFLATGPAVAGFALASQFTRTWMGIGSLGAILAALMWIANGLMFAGGSCCSTLN